MDAEISVWWGGGYNSFNRIEWMDEHIVKLMVSKVDGTARIVNSLILGLLGCLDQNKRGLDGQKMDSQTLILGT